MLIQLVLAGGCEAGGDDGQHVGSRCLGHLALLDGFLGGDAAGAGVYGNAAVYLVDYGFQNQLLLLCVQDVAFAVGSEGEQGVNAALDLTVYLAAQLGDVDALILVHGGDDWGDNAF